jgi:hypothetical protein
MAKHSTTFFAGFSVFLFATAIFSLSCHPEQYYVDVTLVNDGKHTLADVMVTVYGEQFSFSKLEPKQSVKFRFGVRGDAHYIVKWSDETGVQKKDIGYIAAGISQRHVLRINGDSVSFELE